MSPNVFVLLGYTLTTISILWFCLPTRKVNPFLI